MMLSKLYLHAVLDICGPISASVCKKEILLNKIFPNKLKLADATPIFKKKEKNIVGNYKPLSVLPTVSKIFERIMQKANE